MITFSVRAPLYQWNANETIVIKGMEHPVDYAVHFSVCGDGAPALERFPYIQNDEVVCDIPNTLLTSGTGTLYVYAYNLKEHRMYTETRAVFPVTPREKPEGYVYGGDEIAVWAETRRAAALATETANAAKTFAMAAADAAQTSAASADYAAALAEAAAAEAGAGALRAEEAVGYAAAGVRSINGTQPDENGNVDIISDIVVQYHPETKTAALTIGSSALSAAL